MKRIVNDSASSALSSMSKLGDIWSGPGDLFGFSGLTLFRTASLETLRSVNKIPLDFSPASILSRFERSSLVKTFEKMSLRRYAFPLSLVIPKFFYSSCDPKQRSK